MSGAIIRLQVNLPKDLSSYMHKRISDLKNENGRLRTRYELTKEENAHLQDLMNVANVRPGGVEAVNEELVRLRIIPSPAAAQLGRRLKIPVLSGALIRTLKNYSDAELLKMMKDYIDWEDSSFIDPI